MLIDSKTNIIYRFEPHGSMFIDELTKKMNEDIDN